MVCMYLQCFIMKKSAMKLRKKKQTEASRQMINFFQASKLVSDEKMSKKALAKQCRLNRGTLARLIDTKNSGYCNTSTAQSVLTDIQQT